jgi:Response regulator containing a CheY-like receiver domain and an HTH DNA-binding domain
LRPGRRKNRPDHEADHSAPEIVSVAMNSTGASASVLGKVLDLFALPVIVVALDGLMLEANAAARILLRSGHGLAICQGQLHAAGSIVPEQWQSALGAFRNGADEPIALAFDQVASRPALRLIAVPLCHEGHTEGVALFVLGQERNLALSEDLLAESYGFSRAEARVALELLRGHDLPAIARELGISLFTVRSHIRNLLSKSEAENLRDLVRRLALEVGALALSTPAR